jgi:hypothetical protein
VRRAEPVGSTPRSSATRIPERIQDVVFQAERDRRPVVLTLRSGRQLEGVPVLWWNSCVELHDGDRVTTVALREVAAVERAA